MSKATELHKEARRARHYGFDARQLAHGKLTAYTKELHDKLIGSGIKVDTAHAYTPRETGSHGGGQHFMLLEDLDAGRLKRKAGDALCKPRAKFWGLDAIVSGAVTCKICAERAERLVNDA